MACLLHMGRHSHPILSRENNVRIFDDLGNRGRSNEVGDIAKQQMKVFQPRLNQRFLDAGPLKNSKGAMVRHQHSPTKLSSDDKIEKKPVQDSHM